MDFGEGYEGKDVVYENLRQLCVHRVANESNHSWVSAEMVVENGENTYLQSQNLSLLKSGCSSTSETSKGSGLSLSRSDVRVSWVKARERARERTAKEKEKESHDCSQNNVGGNPFHHQQNVNSSSVSQTALFTELITGGINNVAARSPRRSGEEPNFFNKVRQQQQQQWSSSSGPMDHYFSPVLIGTPSSSRTHHQHHQLGHSLHDHQSLNISPHMDLNGSLFLHCIPFTIEFCLPSWSTRIKVISQNSLRQRNRIDDLEPHEHVIGYFVWK